MAKKNFGIRSDADRGSPGGRIRSANDLVPDGLIVFSFKYFAIDHPDYHANDAEAAYFLLFISRMKEMCCLTMQSIISRKADSVLRFHQTNFAKETVTAAGFGIPQCEQFDDVAWQFAITRNEHGRVHGFVIDTTFFMVWLDPDHKLDPGRQVTGN